MTNCRRLLPVNDFQLYVHNSGPTVVFILNSIQYVFVRFSIVVFPIFVPKIDKGTLHCIVTRLPRPWQVSAYEQRMVRDGKAFTRDVIVKRAYVHARGCQTTLNAILGFFMAMLRLYSLWRVLLSLIFNVSWEKVAIFVFFFVPQTLLFLCTRSRERQRILRTTRPRAKNMT